VAALLDGREARQHAVALDRRLAAAEATPALEATVHGLRRRKRWFEELESYRPALRKLPVDRSRLIVLPGVRPEARVLVPVARGRVLPRVEVSTEAPEWPERVADTCYRIRVEELRSEAAFPVEALTLTLIVGRWLRTHTQDRREKEDAEAGDDARVFDLDRRDAPYVIERLRCASRSAVRSG
jgi:hypothetical protein